MLEVEIVARSGQSAYGDVVMLVDEDVTCDRRVLGTLAEYSEVEVIDCASEKLTAGTLSIRAYLNGVKFLIAAAFRSAALWKLLRLKFGLRANNCVSGLLISFRTFVRAREVARRLESRMNGVRLIHSHDLYCGVIGAELARYRGAKLIYDAHEVEFHRNRRNSWLRLAFDWAAEKSVIEHAQEIRVVNTPIAEVYRCAYPGISDRLRVVTNDHFPSLPAHPTTLAAPESATIVYVGGGLRGRQLEQLAISALDLCIPVHAFFIGEIPKFAVEAGWELGGSDYEEKLAALAISHRCVMWCCVEHVCLSYRLSLPNKFFQALALGMPVIVSSGGYLEQLVGRYEIGAVFDGTNLDQTLVQLRSNQYLYWIKQVSALREGISEGRIQL